MKRTASVILTTLFFCGIVKAAAPEKQQTILRGPLRLSANETISKNHGELIEAFGHVKMHYDMETGDQLDSTSDYARYEEKKAMGEISGNPKAIWRQKNTTQADTLLDANKIILKIDAQELHAEGNVLVRQSSYTLTAQEISFYNRQKKMTAQNQRPTFTVNDADQRTVIRADQIIAWTEKKQIHFNGSVKGSILLSDKK